MPALNRAEKRLRLERILKALPSVQADYTLGYTSNDLTVTAKFVVRACLALPGGGSAANSTLSLAFSGALRGICTALSSVGKRDDTNRIADATNATDGATVSLALLFVYCGKRRFAIGENSLVLC